MNQLPQNNMTREEILNEMAVAAVNSFEFSCSWPCAAQAARQEARDLRQSADKAFVLHAINLAKIIWNERVIEAKQS
jgi:hypothetical protein